MFFFAKLFDCKVRNSRRPTVGNPQFSNVKQFAIRSVDSRHPSTLFKVIVPLMPVKICRWRVVVDYADMNFRKQNC